MREIIEKEFDWYIQTNFKKESIRSYLMQCDRRERCINAIFDEIKKIELAPVFFGQELFKRVIHDVCAMYSKAALKYAEEKAVSRLERQRRIDEANNIEEAKGLLQEMEDEATSTAVKSFPTVNE